MAGSSTGTTKITVSPSKLVSTNKYKYRVQESDFTSLPELVGNNLTAWTTWDGTRDITATNGYYIAVAETNSNFICEKIGKTKVVSFETQV